MLRKHVYGGIPPTDERILAMTEEQIDLEYEHLYLDKQAKDGTKNFEDDEYDKYDEESETTDSEITDETDYEQYFGKATNPPASEGVQADDAGEWEDVEDDDLYDWDKG